MVFDRIKKVFATKKTDWKGALSKAVRAYKRLTAKSYSKATLRKLYTNEVFSFKGVNKKGRDLIGSYFTVSDNAPDKIKKATKEWERKIKTTFEEAVRYGYIYGDGYVEKLYKGDVPDGKKAPKGKLVDLHIVDSETVTDKDIDTGHLIQRGRGKGGKLFAAKEKIHPDRIIEFTPYPLGDQVFGVSVMEVGYNLILSKMNADDAYGDYVADFGHGLITQNIEGANTDEIDHAYNQMLKMKRFLIGSEKHKFGRLNMTTFDPDPFNNFFYLGIAAALEMPPKVLIGEIRRETAPEIDRAEYYDLINKLQESWITPIIKDLFFEITGVVGDEYDIIWNKVYSDETTEGEIMKMKASTARMLYLAVGEKPILTVDEARDILGLPEGKVTPRGDKRKEDTMIDVIKRGEGNAVSNNDDDRNG
jgi:hypothetical protein